MKTNHDLLGRPIRTARVVDPDASCLSLEDQTLVNASKPRRYNLSIHIKSLEARASQREDRYGRDFYQGHADRLRKQLNQQ